MPKKKGKYIGFKKLAGKLSKKYGSKRAAAIGRKKYGKKKFQKMAATGRKKKR